MVEPLEVIFPGLGDAAFRVTSPATRAYNCIGWAVGETARWWWPEMDPDNDAIFWPPGVAREETVDAFVAMFATVGFDPCDGEDLETGYERVALFAKDGVPTHAARQLASGRWTSKLGMREDIEHGLHALSGEAYGGVTIILKRPIAG